MGKTTNILDLNNRLTKVEKENVTQNSYTSLKNKPKINGVTLTGNKSLADIGAAAAADLETLAGDVNILNRGSIRYYPIVSIDNKVGITLPKANSYTIRDISVFGYSQIPEAIGEITDGYQIGWISPENGYLVIKLVGTYENVNVGQMLSILVEIQ